MQSVKTAKEVSVDSVLAVLRRHWLVVTAGTLVVTAGFVGYAVLQPTRYQADALLGAEPTPVNDYVKSNMPREQLNVQDKLWLIRDRLFSPTVLEPLIEKYHFDRDADDIETRLTLLANKLGQTLHIVGTSQPPEQDREEATIEALKSRIKIRVEANDAFSLGFEAHDREQAAEVANRLAESLVERTSAATEANASSAAGFLKAEAERMKAKLDEQNQAIQRFRERTGDDLSTRMAGDLKMLEDMQEQIHAKTAEISNEESNHVALVQEIQDLEKRGALESHDRSASASKLEELRIKLKELQSTYTPEYPEIKSTQKEISDLEKAGSGPADPKDPSRGEPSEAEMRYVGLKAQLGASDQKLESYRKQEKDLASEMSVYRQKAEQAPGNERALSELVRDYELTRTQYQALLEKQNQAQLDERLDQGDRGSAFRIVSQARPPLLASGPHRVRIALMGLLAGLALGVGMAFGIDLRDTSYNDAEEFQASTALPVLSVIPTLSLADNGRHRSPKELGKLPLELSVFQAQGASPKDTVVTLHDPKSIAAEQYGILAVELRQRLGRDASRILAITSPAGGEGKTITSLNLSIALSMAMGGQVLLVESDLRKPRLHEYLGFRPKKGLSDLLQQPDAPLDDHIWRINGLSIIPAGPMLDEPLKFLASPKTQDLFGRFRQRFQFVVVDSPPIVPIADSHILAQLADGVLLVIRARQTRRELLEHALQNFHHANIIGVVLNGADLRQSRYYYAYDYYSEHYLGEGKRKRA